MPIEELVELYPMEFATAVGAGMAMVLVFFILFTIYAILDTIATVFRVRRRAAMCLGFHNGMITGECHCHGCPYAYQCTYYEPRRSFRVWLNDLREQKKKKP